MKALLSFMDTEDKTCVLRGYEELFDNAGREGEEQLIEQLGSPVRQVLIVEKKYRERQSAGLPGVETETQQEEQTPSEQELPARETSYAEEISYEQDAPYAEAAPYEQEIPYSEEASYAEDTPVEEMPPVEETAPLNEQDAAPVWQGAPYEVEDSPAAAPMENTAQDAADEIFPEQAVPLVELATDTPAEEHVEEAYPEEEAQPREEDADEYDEPQEDEPKQEKLSGGQIVLTVLLTPLMIVLALLGVALTFLLAAIVLLPAAALGAGAVYLTLYALSSMSYLPDMLLVLGAAIGALAFTLLFLWAGIYLLVRGITLTVHLISGAYGRVLKKGGSDND